MAAKDKYHDHVRRALEKDGWTITHDPYFLKLEGVTYPVDLGAEKMIAAQKENKKILVEVKSFIAESIPNEFHSALGQYLDYELGLEEIEPDRLIFLAIPEIIYRKIQTIPILMKALHRFDVKLIIFDPNLNEIKQWLTD
ncbi:MAG: XisH family protein [Saprospiraceae bacterium]|jgi:ferric iron reductase protein FhuF|nr:XisH family protein [Saprospiraceae bacterium]